MGKTEWDRRSKLKKKSKEKYIGQFNKFEKYMGRWGRKGKGQQKRGRKRYDYY